MDEFTDAQLEQKIALVKASPEYAAYKAKLNEIAPAYSDAEKHLQAHLSALVQEQRNRAASGTATAILQSVAKVPEKRKLQRPVSWTTGGFVHSKQGGSKSEDLSCKRQFEQVDKADDVFFDVKQQLEGLEAPESITEEQLAKSALAEEEFVSEAVLGLVRSGAAEEWFTQPEVVSPLAVAYRDLGPEQAAVLRDVSDIGFLVNQEKSVLDFRQLIEFLGVGIDSVRGVFYVPQAKWDAFQARASRTLSGQWTSPRELFRLAGKIQSFSLALGKVCQMFSRELYFEVERHSSWDVAIQVPVEVAEELRFWLSVQRRQFEAPIWPVFMAFRNRMWTDAGGTGWGAVLEAVTGRLEQVARGHLTLAERQESSTHREMVGYLQALRSFSGLRPPPA
ncbi:hypothetical protein CYMTET_16089 [Cymbomonas tetramitiformis]|uniref:Uncharacterized protein n=1 Tax=Cymbomonas tetramitiformis TaxID=36881 RepID=A0AAE0GD45_9CHLO|nr:hypothetical protein CYMTET_16089 [Cymbomonas tetramitiformis]